jgi:hypothetical protein
VNKHYRLDTFATVKQLLLIDKIVKISLVIMFKFSSFKETIVVDITGLISFGSVGL